MRRAAGWPFAGWLAMAQIDVFGGREPSPKRTVESSTFWVLVTVLAAIAAGFVAGTRIDSIALLIVAGGGIAVLVTLARLEWALLAVVIITYTNLSEIATNFHGLPPVGKLYVPLVWSIILVRWLLKGEKPGGSSSAFLVFGAYGLVSVSSASYAIDPNLAFSSSVDLAKDALVALTALAILKRATMLRKTIWALLLSGAFLSVGTVYQYLTGTYPIAVGGFSQASIELIAVGTDNTWRHTGPLDDPNHYGQILVVLVPLALERITNDKSRLLRLVAMGVLSFLLVGVLLSYSRGAMFALVCMGALFLISYPGRLKILIPLLVSGILIVQFAPPSYLERVGTASALLPNVTEGGIQHEEEVDIAVEGRFGEMMVAVQMFLDHSFLGVGYANYEQHYQRYELMLNLRPRGQARSAHSLFLEIAAEQGLVGLTVFGSLMVLLLLSVVRAARVFRGLGLREYEQMAIALGIALMGYGITAVFLHNSYARYMWLLIGIVLALPQIVANELRERELPPQEETYGPRQTV